MHYLHFLKTDRISGIILSILCLFLVSNCVIFFYQTSNAISNSLESYNHYGFDEVIYSDQDRNLNNQSLNQIVSSFSQKTEIIENVTPFLYSNVKIGNISCRIIASDSGFDSLHNLYPKLFSNLPKNYPVLLYQTSNMSDISENYRTLFGNYSQTDIGIINASSQLDEVFAFNLHTRIEFCLFVDNNNLPPFCNEINFQNLIFLIHISRKNCNLANILTLNNLYENPAALINSATFIIPGFHSSFQQWSISYFFQRLIFLLIMIIPILFITPKIQKVFFQKHYEQNNVFFKAIFINGENFHQPNSKKFLPFFFRYYKHFIYFCVIVNTSLIIMFEFNMYSFNSLNYLVIFFNSITSLILLITYSNFSNFFKELFIKKNYLQLHSDEKRNRNNYHNPLVKNVMSLSVSCGMIFLIQFTLTRYFLVSIQTNQIINDQLNLFYLVIFPIICSIFLALLVRFYIFPNYSEIFGKINNPNKHKTPFNKIENQYFTRLSSRRVILLNSNILTFIIIFLSRSIFGLLQLNFFNHLKDSFFLNLILDRIYLQNNEIYYLWELIGSALLFVYYLYLQLNFDSKSLWADTIKKYEIFGLDRKICGKIHTKYLKANLFTIIGLIVSIVIVFVLIPFFSISLNFGLML